MARKPKIKETIMTDPNEVAVTEKKTRKPQAPRVPSPFYIFVKIEGDKAKASQSFKDPRKMAQYLETANANGEQLLVVTPE